MTAPQGKPRDGSVDLVALSKDPEWLARITDLRRDCTQLADEKVSIAQQVRGLFGGLRARVGGIGRWALRQASLCRTEVV